MRRCAYQSATAFFVGTALAGSGFGTAFQGSVRTVVPLAAPHERGSVLSVIFVVSYLAMGLPAVITGYLVARSGNISGIALEFGIMVMLLAALALTEMENPKAMAPQLEKLVEEKRQVDERAAAIAEELGANQIMRMVTEEDTRALLANLSMGLQGLDRGHVKSRLRALLSKIEVDPAMLSARSITPSRPQPGIAWRPHGDSNPGYRRERAMS